MDKKIINKECKFVLKVPDDLIEDDIHIVKELITYEDNTKEYNLNVIKNFQRPFWITKKHFQNHQQKKESEDVSRLDKFNATQKDLPRAIAARLGQRYITAKTMRDVAKSPYLYGTDIDTRAIIKKIYMDKYPEVTPYSLTTLDIETNIDTGEIIIISVATYDKIYVGILDNILITDRDVQKQLHYLFEKYIPKTDISSKIQPTFEIFKTEQELLENVFLKLHEWKTDFIAVWNIDFDVPYIVERCQDLGIDPKDLFSSPELPKELRYFKYKQGQKLKVTESGVHKPINPEEQWHTVLTPSYSYWIDAMCSHRYVRVGGKAVPGGYSLNNILEKELGQDMKKLHFDDDPNITNLSGIDWHKYMIANKPLEYIIYNCWDTMSMLELDNKTKDLNMSIGALIGISSFDIFNSGPKKIIDALHFFYMDNGRILGVRDQKVSDDDILGLSGFIMILESAYKKDNRGQFILEDPESTTNINYSLADLDAVSSYPSDTLAANVSKDTTSRELISIEGFEKEDFVRQNINLFFGKVNAVEYCNEMLRYPYLEDLSNKFKQEHNL